MQFPCSAWSSFFILCQYCGISLSIFLNIYVWEPNALAMSLCLMFFFIFHHMYYYVCDLTKAVNFILGKILSSYILLSLCYVAIWKIIKNVNPMNVGDLFYIVFFPCSFFLSLLILWTKIVDLLRKNEILISDF